jgi:hypothetical protein
MMDGDNIVCNKCHVSKSVEEFRLRKHDGFRFKTCKKCCYQIRKKWINKNPDKVRDEQVRSRKKNDQLFRDAAKEYYMKNPERVAETLKKSRFRRALYRSQLKAVQRSHLACNATEEQISSLFTGKCFVCGVSESDCRVSLCMDHNHATGEFRGWICEDCNIAAGKIKDNPMIAQQLSNYLQGKYHA